MLAISPPTTETPTAGVSLAGTVAGTKTVVVVDSVVVTSGTRGASAGAVVAGVAGATVESDCGRIVTRSEPAIDVVVATTVDAVVETEVLVVGVCGRTMTPVGVLTLVGVCDPVVEVVGAFVDGVCGRMITPDTVVDGEGRRTPGGMRSINVVVVEDVVVVARVVVVVSPPRVIVVVVMARRATVVVVWRRFGASVTVVVVKIVVVVDSMMVEVVVVGSMVVVVGPTSTTGATGVTASMFDSGPVPIALIARIFTWYSTPLVRPAMLSGDVVDPTGHATQVTPLSVEYSWFVSADPPELPAVNRTDIARSLAVSCVIVGAYGRTAAISKDWVTSVAAW
jgi:hypothetical protein